MKTSLSMQKRRGSLFRATEWAVLAGIVVLLASKVYTLRSEIAFESSEQNTASLSSNAVARVEGNTAFAFELYARLKGTNGNLLFSPWSISSALGMTYAGARGTTERQIASTLHFDTNQKQLRATVGELREILARPSKGIELNMADGLWAQAGHPFLPSFLDVLNRSYGATPRLVDFDSQAVGVAQEMNSWVAGQTKGRSTDVVTPESLGNLTRLVLVDTVYFKGVWKTKFDPDATTDAPFYLNSSNSVTCRMMKCRGSFRHAENFPDCDLIELPYGNGDLSMVVVLPSIRFDVAPPGDSFPSLESLESKLSPESLARWEATARYPVRSMDVYLPKFSFRKTTELAQVLSRMGMPDAFQDGVADFSGMDDMRDLRISIVKHDAFVEVNEEGTTAGAATEVHLNTRSAGPPCFSADHPFLFLIRDNRTKVILFLGRVTDPART